MRIAYVIPAYPPAPSQPFVVNEMVQVQEAGHTLFIVPLYAASEGPIKHGTFERLRPEDVMTPALISLGVLAAALRVLVTHPVRVLRTIAAAHRAAGWNPFAHARLLALTPKALAASSWLRRRRIDRIHAHFASQTADCAAIAGAVSGIPFSFTAHAYDIYSTGLRVRNDTLTWKLRTARQAFTVNDFAGRLLRSHLPPEHAGRVQTSYVGIPMHLFRRETAAPRPGPFRLLCVARLCEKKGLDTLVDACGVLRDRGLDFELRVFGDGPLRGELAAQIARLDLASHVLLGGAVTQEDVAREMRACHAFVMPCRKDKHGDMDGIPTVFMEAMATGRPVISCPVSGVPELVRDRDTGLLVPPDDPVALAEAIVTLAHDDALRERLADRGRDLVERQHDERLSARLLLARIRAADAAESGVAVDPSSLSQPL